MLYTAGHTMIKRRKKNRLVTDSKKPDVVLDQVPSGEVMQERGSSETVRRPLCGQKANDKNHTTEEQLLQRLTSMTDI